MPTAVFSTPEIGTVGLPEDQARERYPKLDVYKARFRPLKHTLSGRDERMFMKLLVDGESGRVVGCHILGADAAEIVQMAAIAMRLGATKADFDATMALHPSAAEELVTMREKWVPPARSPPRPSRPRRGRAPMPRLEGRIALVTGAGAGIGRAIAVLFAAEGAHVYVTDVDGAAAEAVAGEIVQAGASAQAIAADVSRGQDVSAMFRAVETAHGRLDVLVNNAGLNVRGDFRHMSDADWVKIREVNLDGVVRVARDGFAPAEGVGARLADQHRLDHGPSRPAPAHRLFRHQGRGAGADARARRRVRALRHPRQRAGARASSRRRSPRAPSRTRASRRRCSTARRCAASACPRRSPRPPCSSPATTPPTSPAPS